MVAVPVVKLTDEDWYQASEKSKIYRHINNISQSQLAQIINCTNQQISTIERNAKGGSSRVAKAILELTLA